MHRARVRPAGRRRRQRWTRFATCEEHIEEMDAAGDLDEWDLAHRILEPWAQSAKLMNDPLAEVMEGALLKLEEGVERRRERLEKAEAALR